MKQLYIICLLSFLGIGVVDAQISNEDLIFSRDSLIVAYPAIPAITGVIPGECGTLIINVGNYSDTVQNISALFLDDAAGTDNFELIDPEQVPFELDTAEWLDVRIDFCPESADEKSTFLMVEYGEGSILRIPIKGIGAQVVNMDWCDNFDSWTTGEWIGNGWFGSVPANSSVYPSATQGWGGTIDGSVALFLRNRKVVDDVRVPIEVITPGVRVIGDDPVISWMEMAYSSFNTSGTNSSPRNLYISTDNTSWELVDSYLSNTMPDPFVNPEDWFKQRIYSLKDYVGQTIWWKFELLSNNNEYIYWVIDNVCVRQRITIPILKHSPDPIDLGGVQIGENASQTISFTNIGVSIAKIKKVDIVSNDGYWTLTDTNNYPVEIHDGNWAYAINGTDKMNIDVSYAPMEIGPSSAQLQVTWGLYEDKVYTVDLSGEGLSCATAAEAFVGENWAAAQNSWFTYTAEKFQIVNINSCHPNNTTDPYVYSYDTWLDVYDDCDGTVIATNDDLEWDACPYNRASSGVQIAMNEGETVKIFWPWAFTSAGDDQGFYFNIVPSYPVDGDVCETAIPLTLPVVNHFGSTVAFADDYDISPCSPFSNYMDGNDKVYSITLEYEGYLTGSILGAYGSIHVLDKCPVEELEKRNCLAFASGPNGGDFFKRIPAGEYYVIISTWSPPQTVDYLLNLSMVGLSIDETELTSNIRVYPNPTSGSFTVDISNPEACDMSLEMLDISGRVVYSNLVKSVYTYNDNIDTGLFSKGVYYLRIKCGEKISFEKVIVR